MLTALFFAVEDRRYDTEIGVLWALEPAALNGAQGLDPALPVPESVHELFVGAFEAKPSTGKIVGVATHEVDIRMMMQLSAFTIHDTDKPLEGILHDYGAFLRRYEILPSAKRHLRDQLELLAIDSTNLFPDLDHLAADLNRRTR